jgi:hypothetical protein
VIDFKKFIADNGVFLVAAGVNNYALSKSQSQKLLQFLTDSGVGVFGGDVYLLKNDNPSLTYDNWYSTQAPGETDEQFNIRSIVEAKNYIDNYNQPEAYFAFTLND